MPMDTSQEQPCLPGSLSLDESLEVSIVIPAYNEEDRLPATIQQVTEYMRGTGRNWELLIADDGSTDRTPEVVSACAALAPQVRLLRSQPNRGKGAAVREGMLATRGRYVLFMDADAATPISEAPKLIAPLERGEFDVVCGSRADPLLVPEATQTPLRRLASILWSGCARSLVVTGIRDTQCGFKAFTREAVDRLFPQLVSTSGIFDIELLLLCSLAQYRVGEVGVRWRHDDRSRITYNARRAAGVFLELWEIRRRWHLHWRKRVNSQFLSCTADANHSLRATNPVGATSP